MPRLPILRRIMRVKIMRNIFNFPFEIGEVCEVNLVQENHFIIYRDNVWYGFFKSDTEPTDDVPKRKIEIYEQLSFNF